MCSNNATLCSVLARHIFSARRPKTLSPSLQVVARGLRSRWNAPGFVSSPCSHLFPLFRRFSEAPTQRVLRLQAKGTRGQKGKAGLSGFWLQPGKRPGRLCPRLLQTLPAAFPEPSLPNSAPSDPSGLGLHRGLMPFGTRASAEALQSCRWEQMVAANDSQRAEGPLLERIAG